MVRQLDERPCRCNSLYFWFVQFFYFVYMTGWAFVVLIYEAVSVKIEQIIRGAAQSKKFENIGLLVFKSADEMVIFILHVEPILAPDDFTSKRLFLILCNPRVC